MRRYCLIVNVPQIILRGLAVYDVVLHACRTSHWLEYRKVQMYLLSLHVIDTYKKYNFYCGVATVAFIMSSISNELCTLRRKYWQDWIYFKGQIIRQNDEFLEDKSNERVVDCLPLMTYGLKLSLEAWILEFKNFDLSFKEII